MTESFDPYRVWLSIPAESRPPTHYDLLGISPKEQERKVIDAAIVRQSAWCADRCRRAAQIEWRESGARSMAPNANSK